MDGTLRAWPPRPGVDGGEAATKHEPSAAGAREAAGSRPSAAGARAEAGSGPSAVGHTPMPAECKPGTSGRIPVADWPSERSGPGGPVSPTDRHAGLGVREGEAPGLLLYQTGGAAPARVAPQLQLLGGATSALLPPRWRATSKHDRRGVDGGRAPPPPQTDARQTNATQYPQARAPLSNGPANGLVHTQVSLFPSMVWQGPFPRKRCRGPHSTIPQPSTAAEANRRLRRSNPSPRLPTIVIVIVAAQRAPGRPDEAVGYSNSNSAAASPPRRR